MQEITPLLRDLGVAFDIATERVEVSGIGALRVTVNHPEQRTHRTFKNIRDLVEGAGLPDRACSRAVEVFRRLAVAEGAVHGRDPEELAQRPREGALAGAAPTEDHHPLHGG